MKFCIHCGKVHSEIPKFCSNCGTAWNAPKQNAITSARKALKRNEDFDDEEEEDNESQESVAALLGGAKKAFKAVATGARLIKAEELSDPNFFCIEDEREQRAANYDFQKDMAKVRETSKGEIN